MDVIKAKEVQKKQILTAKEAKIQKFYDDLEASHDLSDNLQQLTTLIQEETGATGVYLGRLERPRLKIEDKDHDNAHVDKEAAKVIKFIHASPADHNYMVSKILKPGQGLSHQVFN